MDWAGISWRLSNSVSAVGRYCKEVHHNRLCWRGFVATAIAKAQSWAAVGLRVWRVGAGPEVLLKNKPRLST